MICIFVNDGKGIEMREWILGDCEKILELVRSLSGIEGIVINDIIIVELEKSIILNISNDWENFKKKFWEEFIFNYMFVVFIFLIFWKF